MTMFDQTKTIHFRRKAVAVILAVMALPFTPILSSFFMKVFEYKFGSSSFGVGHVLALLALFGAYLLYSGKIYEIGRVKRRGGF